MCICRQQKYEINWNLQGHISEHFLNILTRIKDRTMLISMWLPELMLLPSKKQSYDRNELQKFLHNIINCTDFFFTLLWDRGRWIKDRQKKNGTLKMCGSVLEIWNAKYKGFPCIPASLTLFLLYFCNRLVLL